MNKVRMRRKPGNVYHTPVNPPASTHTPQRINPRTGEVLGTHDMTETENAKQWYDIFREMAAECPDHHQRKRQRRQQQK